MTAMARTASPISKLLPILPNPSIFKTSFPSHIQIPTLLSPLKTLTLTLTLTTRTSRLTAQSSTANFHGLSYVLGDNIDTDQIIPAEYLTLVPSNPDEYKRLGSLALIGLPTASYPIPFIIPGEISTRFSVIIGGNNFGCGSSREHAPVAIGASGARVVVAESYARIFFRNCVATGEIYPLEIEEVGVWKECDSGDVVTVDLVGNRLVNHTKGKEYKLKPIGDAGPVIEAGGIFAYARKTGMIASAAD